MGRSNVSLEIASTWDGRPLPPEAVVRVDLTLDADALRVTVAAPFYGDPAPAGRVGPTWQLWEHEVVEVFVAGPAERYTELELGPWGHYLALRLDGRRHIVERDIQLELTTVREGGRWRAEALLDAVHLPAGPHRVNAYAIHGLGETRSYAAAFPSEGPEPDFHRLETFRPWG